ncbi:beta/gamma crystallin-related protein [Accumulibacter sp.]|uniref:beta/gamma crystallin-related protein n=1 Tax=Accumulibacter sp. TaxID=2053492 RepID=UPI00260CC8E8|nr:beta/gamma crystallin-related protein [Accumulibacter sp.]
MNATLRNTPALASIVLATQAAAQVTFYEREGFAGRSFTTNELVRNFERYGFNDRASSLVVSRNPGKSAKTSASPVAVSSCVRAGIRPWRRWA